MSSVRPPPYFAPACTPVSGKALPPKGLAVARATGTQYGGRILTLPQPGTTAKVLEPEATSGKEKAGATVSSFLFGPGPTRG